MTLGSRRLLALGVGLAASVGCQRSTTSSREAPAAASQSASPPIALAPAPPLESARCRAMRVTGVVKTSAGTPLDALHPVDDWLTLAPDAEVLIRDARSAREFVLTGPGQAHPCWSGQEQVLLESGSLKSVLGTGVRPGAELWVGTPFGTARYADANLELAVDAREWRITVKSGAVWTEPRLHVNGRPAEERLLAGQQGVGGAAPPTAAALVDDCRAREEHARRAAETLTREGTQGLGKRAAAEFGLRRSARAACLWASAAERRAQKDAEEAPAKSPRR